MNTTLSTQMNGEEDDTVSMKKQQFLGRVRQRDGNYQTADPLAFEPGTSLSKWTHAE